MVLYARCVSVRLLVGLSQFPKRAGIYSSMLLYGHLIPVFQRAHHDSCDSRASNGEEKGAPFPGDVEFPAWMELFEMSHMFVNRQIKNQPK